MKLSKRLQYALLFTLYLCRSGRTTVQAVSENLDLSRSFLEQVARRLRLAGVVQSTRGFHGGYELTGEPTVLDVFNAVSPVQLLEKGELSTFAKGGSEKRAFAHYINSMGQAMESVLRRKVHNLGRELVMNEMAQLKRLPTNRQAN